MIAIRTANGIPSDELAANVSFRFGHTVFEARKKGYLVEKGKLLRTYLVSVISSIAIRYLVWAIL